MFFKILLFFILIIIVSISFLLFSLSLLTNNITTDNIKDCIVPLPLARIMEGNYYEDRIIRSFSPNKKLYFKIK